LFFSFPLPANLLIYYCRSIAVVYYPGLATGGDEPGHFLCVSYREIVMSPDEVPEAVLKSFEERLSGKFKTIDSLDNTPPLLEYKAKLWPLVAFSGFHDYTSDLPISNRLKVEKRQERRPHQPLTSTFGRFDDGVISRLKEISSYRMRVDLATDTLWAAGVSRGHYWFR